jgi:hypothetical protein
MLLTRLLAALRRRSRFNRSFQLGHPLNEASQETSMLLKHLATNVKVFLTVRHLTPQSLNQCSIPLDLTLMPSLHLALV